MTTTETETMLTERLARLASYAPALPTVEFSDLPLVRVIEAPRRRAPVWAVAAGVAVVLGAGTIAIVTLAPGSDDAGRAHTVASNPTPVVHPLTVEAHNFYFSDESHQQTTNFNVPAGITEITFVSAEGSHTLAFAEPEFSSVALSAPDGRSSVKVDLVEGHVYTIFDTIPGHRQSGMEATITVGPPTSTNSVDQIATTTTTIPVPLECGGSGEEAVRCVAVGLHTAVRE